MNLTFKEFEHATLFPSDRHAEDEVERREKLLSRDVLDKFDFVVRPHGWKAGSVIQVTEYVPGSLLGKTAGYL